MPHLLNIPLPPQQLLQLGTWGPAGSGAGAFQTVTGTVKAAAVLSASVWASAAVILENSHLEGHTQSPVHQSPPAATAKPQGLVNCWLKMEQELLQLYFP